MTYTPITTELEFQALFAHWPKFGPTIRWTRQRGQLYRTCFHAIGPNRKTACGLTVPAIADLAEAEAGGDTTCANCRATWTVR